MERITPGDPMAIDLTLIDKLRADYKKSEDIISEHGLLKQLTKAVLERAMQAERTENLGYESTTRPATTAATRATARRPRR
jgi:putative transposase